MCYTKRHHSLSYSARMNMACDIRDTVYDFKHMMLLTPYFRNIIIVKRIGRQSPPSLQTLSARSLIKKTKNPLKRHEKLRKLIPLCLLQYIHYEHVNIIDEWKHVFKYGRTVGYSYAKSNLSLETQEKEHKAAAKKVCLAKEEEEKEEEDDDDESTWGIEYLLKRTRLMCTRLNHKCSSLPLMDPLYCAVFVSCPINGVCYCARDKCVDNTATTKEMTIIQQANKLTGNYKRDTLVADIKRYFGYNFIQDPKSKLSFSDPHDKNKKTTPLLLPALMI